MVPTLNPNPNPNITITLTLTPYPTTVHSPYTIGLGLEKGPLF